MKNLSQIRPTLVWLLLAACLLLAAAALSPVSAAATTSTQTLHNDTFPIFNPLNPCNPAIGTSVVNGVIHFTEAGNGSIHTTMTLTGSFEVTDLNSGQTATGHFTFSGGQNVNLNSQVRNSETFILNAHGELEDGTVVRFNLVGQLREVDGVPTLDFLKANCH